MAEIFARRTGLPAGDRELWWVDPQAGRRRRDGRRGRRRPGRWPCIRPTAGSPCATGCPQVARLFAEPAVVGDLVVRAIVWRTYLITDEEAMAAVDGALAEQVTRWGALSIDQDRTGHRRPGRRATIRARCAGPARRPCSSRTVAVRLAPLTSPGTTSIWARLCASPDAALVAAARRRDGPQRVRATTRAPWPSAAPAR